MYWYPCLTKQKYVFDQLKNKFNISVTHVYYRLNNELYTK